MSCLPGAVEGAAGSTSAAKTGGMQIRLIAMEMHRRQQAATCHLDL
jgi:hypothetical protein